MKPDDKLTRLLNSALFVDAVLPGFKREADLTPEERERGERWRQWGGDQSRRGDKRSLRSTDISLYFASQNHFPPWLRTARKPRTQNHLQYAPTCGSQPHTSAPLQQAVDGRPPAVVHGQG